MRIAQISTLGTRVGPTGAGSIEGLVWLLARELSRLGHELTVFAAAGSEVCGGTLVQTLPGTYGHNGAPADWQLCEWMNLCRAVERSADFDVIHSHNYLWGIPLEPLSAAPIVHTLHISPQDDHRALRAMHPGAYVTATSHVQWDKAAEFKPFAVIHHGVDPDEFTYCPDPGEYACYLGRFIPEKGVLAAIATARQLGLALRLAGPANDYYRKHVEPHVDGAKVRYEGTVTGARRNELLGGARVLLYPVQIGEPFGLVMVEAMMCGTPVAATRRGAVTEVVDEGVTGYSVDTPDELATAVRQCMTLDRRHVRHCAERRFSVSRMASDYLRVYERLIAEHGSAARDGHGTERQ
jgi:glycosyltransferase involved in cell wall biosynthesis